MGNGEYSNILLLLDYYANLFSILSVIIECSIAKIDKLLNLFHLQFEIACQQL
jgi:hypothetical protein